MFVCVVEDVLIMAFEINITFKVMLRGGIALVITTVQDLMIHTRYQ